MPWDQPPLIGYRRIRHHTREETAMGQFDTAEGNRQVADLADLIDRKG